MVGFPLTSTKARAYAHDREVGIPITTAETKSPAAVHFTSKLSEQKSRSASELEPNCTGNRHSKFPDKIFSPAFTT